MTVKRTFNAPVQVGAESAYGTAVTVTEPIGRVQNFTYNFSNSVYESRGAGAGRNAQSTSFGNATLTWNLNSELHAIPFMKYAVGPRTGSGTAGSPYVFTEAAIETDLPSFTAELGNNEGTDVVDTLAGLCVTNWSISGNKSTAVMVKMNGFGRSLTAPASTTAYTEPTTDSFMTHQSAVYFGTSPTLIGELNSWVVSCNNSTQPITPCDSRFNEGYTLGRLIYAFTITCMVSEDTYRTLRTSLYGNSSAPVDGTQGTMAETDELRILVSEGASTGNRNIEIWLDPVFLNTVEKIVDLNNNMVLATFTGTSHGGKSNQPLRYWTV